MGAPVSLPHVTGLPVRGVIEGFYGEPWSHDERLRLLADLGAWGMNRYVYAPKDDARHRARWREPYPPDEAARLGGLAEAGRAAGVELVYALHPGLDMVHADEGDHAHLAAKLRALHALGIRRFALLFDDIEYGLADPRDRAIWGEGAAGSGRAHGATCTRVETEVLAPLGLGGTLLMVPTDYAGSGRTEYRDGLDETLGRDIGVMWTGDDIVVGEVTAAHVRGAAVAFGHRPLVLWDNFPVNDFDPSRAFLGPLVGREAPAELHGILANPMVQCEPSRFALHAVAAWARDAGAYDPATAAEQALHAVAGQDADALRPLLAAASAWPPSRAQHPALAAAVEAAFAGDRSALDPLLADLRGLAGLPTTTPLLEALRPWALAGGLTADVVEAAVAGDEDAVVAAWEAARTATHGLARDIARAAAERALGRPVPDPVKVVTGVPTAG